MSNRNFIPIFRERMFSFCNQEPIDLPMRADPLTRLRATTSCVPMQSRKGELNFTRYSTSSHAGHYSSCKKMDG